MATDQLIIGSIGQSNVLKVVDTSAPNVNTDETLSQTRSWYSVAHNGQGTYVAGARGTNRIAYSTDDGATWTVATIVDPGAGSVLLGHSVFWDGSRFIAGTNNYSRLAYSTNGSTWTFITFSNPHGYPVHQFAVAGNRLWGLCSTTNYDGTPSVLVTAGSVISTDSPLNGEEWVSHFADVKVGYEPNYYENYKRIFGSEGKLIYLFGWNNVAKVIDTHDPDLAPVDCNYTTPDPDDEPFVYMTCAAYNGEYWLGGGYVVHQDGSGDEAVIGYSADGESWEFIETGDADMAVSDVFWDGTDWWLTMGTTEFLDTSVVTEPTDSALLKFAPGSPVLTGTITRYDPSGDQGTGYIGIAGYPSPYLYDELQATFGELDTESNSSADLFVTTNLVSTSSTTLTTEPINQGYSYLGHPFAILSGTSSTILVSIDFTNTTADFEVTAVSAKPTGLIDMDSSAGDDFEVTIGAVANNTYILFSRPNGTRGPSFSVTIEEPTYNRGAYPDGVRRPLRMVLIQPNGTKLGEFTKFNIRGGITDTLNEIDTLNFTVSSSDANYSLLTVPDVEVQVWRGRRIIFWGPVVKGETDGDLIKCLAKSLDWYFTKLHFGRANRTNLLSNPNFDHGLGGWNVTTIALKPEMRRSDGTLVEGSNTPQLMAGVNDDFDPEYAHGYSEWPRLRGRHSIRMSNPDYTEASFSNFQHYDAFNEAFTHETRSSMMQSIFQWKEVSGGPNGTKAAFVAWVYVPEILPDYGMWKPNPASSGIVLARMDAGFDPSDTTNWFESIAEQRQTTISNTHEKNRWVRHVIELDIPANTTCWLWCRLEGPYGQYHWSACSLTLDEALENVDPNGDDQAELFRRIVEHAQDTDFGRVDLNITTSTPATPVKRIKRYRYTEHEDIWGAMTEYPTLYDGLDFWWVYTATERMIVTSHPRKGVKVDNLVFELGANVKEAVVHKDGESVASAIVILAPIGEDSGREEGFAIDTSVLAGGLVLEKIYRGTPGASIDTLDAQAERGLKRFSNGVVVPSITLADPTGHLFWRIDLGNVHRVKINYRWISEDADYRIMSKTLDPDTGDITLVMNKEFV